MAKYGDARSQSCTFIKCSDLGLKKAVDSVNGPFLGEKSSPNCNPNRPIWSPWSGMLPDEFSAEKNEPFFLS